jgi:hypothetical protein
LAPLEHERIGDDVLLTNVLAFDVQVWDSGAEIREDNDIALEPDDPGWSSAGTVLGNGAYVDLGYEPGPTAGTPFQRVNPDRRPSTGSMQFPSAATDPRVYDTWSLHYENDGIENATGNPGGDFGTDGLDHATLGLAGVVDDVGEYDTQPPYTAPLRGIRITIRVYEPDSQQVREAVVIQDFLPD